MNFFNPEKIINLYKVISNIEMMDWQKKEIEKFCKKKHDIPYLIVAPRRNGKSEIIKSIAIYAMLKGMKVIYTVHDATLAIDVWNSIYMSIPLSMFEARNRNLKTFTTKSGGSMIVRMRNLSVGVGMTCDLLIIDEVQEYTTAQAAVLEPTVATGRLDGYSIIYTGTAPKSNSTGNIIHERFNSRKKYANDTSIYGITSFCKKPTKKQWSAANPSYGIILHDQYFKSMLASSSISDFNSEQLGVFEKQETELNYSYDSKKINEMSFGISKNEAPHINILERGVSIRYDAVFEMYCAVEIFLTNKISDGGECGEVIGVLDLLGVVNGNMIDIRDLMETIYNIDPDVIYLDVGGNIKMITEFIKRSGIPISRIKQTTKSMFLGTFNKLKNSINSQSFFYTSDSISNALKKTYAVKLTNGIDKIMCESTEDAIIAYTCAISLYLKDELTLKYT